MTRPEARTQSITWVELQPDSVTMRYAARAGATATSLGPSGPTSSGIAGLAHRAVPAHAHVTVECPLRLPLHCRTEHAAISGQHVVHRRIRPGHRPGEQRAQGLARLRARRARRPRRSRPHVDASPRPTAAASRIPTSGGRVHRRLRPRSWSAAAGVPERADRGRQLRHPMVGHRAGRSPGPAPDERHSLDRFARRRRTPAASPTA